MSEQIDHSETWANRALLAGALVGLLIAALAAVPRSDADLNSDGAIARINHQHIDRTAFASAYQALLADKNKAPTAADKKMALDRLIEEELLVQRGLEIGLLEGDAAVRKAVASAVIQFVLAQNNNQPISEDNLRTYYQENKIRFSPAARLHINRIFIRRSANGGSEAESDDARRLEAVRQALRSGTPFAQVADQLGDRLLPQLPQVLLPRAKMIDYLGPDLTEAVAVLPQGSITDALVTDQGWQFLQVIANQPSQTPAFETMRPQLMEALSRSRDDQALRDYINWLRARADIDLAADAPQ